MEQEKTQTSFDDWGITRRWKIKISIISFYRSLGEIRELECFHLYADILSIIKLTVPTTPLPLARGPRWVI